MKANFYYQDNEGSLFVDNVGFRTKGNTSRVLIENEDGSLNLSHFKIRFNHEFDLDPESKIYKAINNRLVFSQEEINLKYNRNYDSTYITEKFSYDLFTKIGVKAPKASLTKFEIKIEDKIIFYGIYTIIEPVDIEFINKRYSRDETDGNLYKSLWQNYGPANLTTITDSKSIGIKDVSLNYRPAYDLKTNKSNPNYNDLLNFIDFLNNSTDDYFAEHIEEFFEVDLFLRYLALGVLLGNPDDYRSMGNNYYLYHNDKTNKFEFIPFDYDNALGQGWDGSPAFSNYTIGADIYNWPNLNEYINPPNYSSEHPLSDRILSINKYRTLYENYLIKYITPGYQIFSYDYFLKVYQLHKEIYSDDIYNSMQNLPFSLRNTKWYFESKIEDVESQLTARGI